MQSGMGADKSQLRWFDRSGKQVGAVGDVGVFANPTLSPDGTRLAFEQTDTDSRHVDVWIRELASNAVTRLTFGPGLNELAVWSPDGKRIAFTSNQQLSYGVLQKNSDGSGSEKQIVDMSSAPQAPWGWSQDGKYILLWKNGELWYLSMQDQQVKPLIQGKWIVRNAQFSPDGKWVAYASNETGGWEIYVSPFPSANSKWQVSRGGGEEPRWRRDGKELFYLAADGKMMAVTLKTKNNFEAGSPVALFQTHLRQPISAMHMVSYDLSGDGQKFLINTKVDELNTAPLSIILNWASEMER
jgi:Tol biopolymer transport system component